MQIESRKLFDSHSDDIVFGYQLLFLQKVPNLIARGVYVDINPAIILSLADCFRVFLDELALRMIDNFTKD